ncbi:MAG: hypothetical protein F6J97_23500 [Leptolyngbya sp. SIO4C1]|nr:hypothetical protein [Leptolyngbya sp. SIO4C1]
MPLELDPDILDKITLEAEQDRERLAQQALDDANDLLNRLNATQNESEQFTDALFKAAAFDPKTPFAPPETVPGYDIATYHELKGIATEQARAWEVAELVAKNKVKAEKVESLYADAALIQAQTQVKYQGIENEGLKLQQAIEVGKLIIAKTEGVQIEQQRQSIVNSNARTLVELEAEKGQAIIEGMSLEIEAIRAENNARLMASQNDFATLKGAGVGGSYSSL